MVKSDFSYVETRFFLGFCYGDFSCVETRFFYESRHCAAVLQTQVPKLCTDLDLGLLCTDLDLSLLYILIFGTYSKFARKNNFLALGVCFPQPCSSAANLHRANLLYDAGLPCQDHVYRTTDVSFPQQKFRWNAFRPRVEKSHSWWPRTVWCVVNMFQVHKNGMRPLIISNGTKCYSILYSDSPWL